jgi:diguanylate cyclase (GGDEF)-like protein
MSNAISDAIPRASPAASPATSPGDSTDAPPAPSVDRRTPPRAPSNAAAAWNEALDAVLGNAGFEQRLQRSWDECREYGLPLSLLLIEVDDAAAAGDARQQLMTRIAAALHSGIRPPGESLAHLDDDRFAVILPALPATQAAATAAQLRNAVEQLHIPRHPERDAGCATISIGVAVADGTLRHSPKQLLDDAVSALKQTLAAAPPPRNAASAAKAADGRTGF